MKKNIGYTIMIVALAIALASCGTTKTVNTEEPVIPPADTDIVIATETPAPTETALPTHTSQPTQEVTEEAPVEILSRAQTLDQWLLNWNEVWTEDALAMGENQGGQFGPGSMKILNEDEGVFEFSESPGEGMFAKLNTPLDEFCGEDCKDGIALLIEYKLVDQINMGLGVTGSPDTNDFGIGWENSWQPNIFWIPEFRKEPFENELAINPDAWYTAMLAIQSNGEYRTAIWQSDNPDNMISYVDSFANHENAETYMDQSWTFKMYGLKSDAVFKVNNYAVYTFEAFKK